MGTSLHLVELLMQEMHMQQLQQNKLDEVGAESLTRQLHTTVRDIDPISVTWNDREVFGYGLNRTWQYTLSVT
jgi:hypothetical protein